MPSERTANYAALDRQMEGETALTYGEREGMRKACTEGIRSSSNLVIELQERSLFMIGDWGESWDVLRLDVVWMELIDLVD